MRKKYPCLNLNVLRASAGPSPGATPAPTTASTSGPAAAPPSGGSAAGAAAHPATAGGGSGATPPGGAPPTSGSTASATPPTPPARPATPVPPPPPSPRKKADKKVVGVIRWAIYLIFIAVFVPVVISKQPELYISPSPTSVWLWSKDHWAWIVAFYLFFVGDAAILLPKETNWRMGMIFILTTIFLALIVPACFVSRPESAMACNHQIVRPGFVQTCMLDQESVVGSVIPPGSTEPYYKFCVHAVYAPVDRYSTTKSGALGAWILRPTNEPVLVQVGLFPATSKNDQICKSDLFK